MKPCTFTFADGPAFPGFAHGTTWNGFDNVSVIPEVREQIAAEAATEHPETAAQLRALPVVDGLVSLADGFASEIEPVGQVGGWITRNGISLCLVEQVSPVVGLYRDHNGGLRLHTGDIEGGFRGYVSSWTKGLFQTYARCHVGDFKYESRAFKTLKGAERALIRVAGNIRG